MPLELPLPTFVPKRVRNGLPSTWFGHLAFCNDLIASHKPSLLVELGTHYGESYFCMCQSVVENGINCTCYAVDHWQGDQHSEQYGEEVFDEVNDYNSRTYRSFSYLLRTTFDDALTQFADASIDLLHIDGFHTYEACSRDFHNWFPKIKPGGLILMHDIMVRHADFGVWRLWDELVNEFPETFAFKQSWGLGVMRKPSPNPTEETFLTSLFNAAPEDAERIRRHYAIYSSYLEQAFTKKPEPEPPPTLAPAAVQPFSQLYVPLANQYLEADSLLHNVELGKWVKLSFELPPFSGSLRFDPINQFGIVQISHIKILDSLSLSPIWEADSVAALKASLSLSPSTFLLPGDETYTIIACDNDPQIALPNLATEGKSRLEIELSFPEDLHYLEKVFAPPPQTQPALKTASTNLKLFPFQPGGYREIDSQSREITIGQWNSLSFDLEANGFLGPVRIDPSSIPCLLEFGEIRVTTASSGDPLLIARGTDQLKHFTPGPSAVFLPFTDRVLLSSGHSSATIQINPVTPFPGPVRLTIDIKPLSDLLPIIDLFSDGSSEALRSERQKLAAALDIAKSELRASQSTRLALNLELAQLAQHKAAAVSERDMIATQLLSVQNESVPRIAVLEAQLASRDKQIAELLTACAAQQAQAQAVLASLTNSLSWRVTQPLRGLMRLVRGGRARNEEQR